jgi:hypothetical protein
MLYYTDEAAIKCSLEVLSVACKFPMLERKIAEHGYRKKEIAQSLEISERAFLGKCSGETDFKWSEVCEMQRRFFPEISKEALMQRTV